MHAAGPKGLRSRRPPGSGYHVLSGGWIAGMCGLGNARSHREIPSNRRRIAVELPSNYRRFGAQSSEGSAGNLPNWSLLFAHGQPIAIIGQGVL